MVSRPLIAALAIGVTIVLFFSLQSVPSVPHDYNARTWKFEFARHANSHSLDASQCDAAFPRLYDNIDEAVSSRIRDHNWVLPEHLELPDGRCMLRVLIYEGEVWGPLYQKSAQRMHANMRWVDANHRSRKSPRLLRIERPRTHYSDTEPHSTSSQLNTCWGNYTKYRVSDQLR